MKNDAMKYIQYLRPDISVAKGRAFFIRNPLRNPNGSIKHNKKTKMIILEEPDHAAAAITKQGKMKKNRSHKPKHVVSPSSSSPLPSSSSDALPQHADTDIWKHAFKSVMLDMVQQNELSLEDVNRV